VAGVIDRRLLAFQLDPAGLFGALGMRADPWQAALLRSRSRRVLVLSTRQCGKSTTCAILALQTALTKPRSLAVLLSASRDQSEELLRRVAGFYDALGRPVRGVKRNTRVLELSTGARILSLAHNVRTVKGYSNADVVICDEAAVLDDALFHAVSPTLAVSGGRLVLVTTPFGERGYFFQQWDGRGEAGGAWERYMITAPDCPRLSKEHLAAERATKGEAEYNQEYMCKFISANDQYFNSEAVARAFNSKEPPLFAPALN
jgi:hypothetical protein